MKKLAHFLMLLTIAGAVMTGCTTEQPTSTTINGAHTKTTTRSISEFVAAQGTFCFDPGIGSCLLFVSPYKNYLGWTDPKAAVAGSIDYAGLADQWIKENSGGTKSFGTTFEGTVTERELSDGRALISVNLKTRNALAWAVKGYDFASSDLLFGWRAADVLNNGKTPSLGDCYLDVDFTIAKPGDPLPDLLKILIAPDAGMSVQSLAFRANVGGTLRALYGVTDGTSGRMEISQTGHLQSNSNSKKFDGFPVEHVKLIKTGD